jgi:hypothetical protein
MAMQRLLNGIYVAIFLVLILLAATLSGCGGNKPMDFSPAIGDSISRAQVRNQTATEHVEAVQPHVRGADAQHLDGAKTDLNKQAVDLVDAQQALLLTRGQMAKMQSQIDTQAAQIDAEQSQWFGDRLHKLATTIIFGGIALWIAVGVAGVFLPGALGSQVLHLLPLSNLFALWRAKAGR